MLPFRQQSQRTGARSQRGGVGSNLITNNSSQNGGNLPPCAPRRKKQKKPKVKTGCLTCKIRRVKCDETKPICNRCIRFGAVCDGYPTPRDLPEKLSGTKSLAPKSLAPNPLYRNHRQPQEPNLHNPLIYSLNSGLRFEDEQESHCYKLYCTESASRIAGPLKTKLWNQLLPQASESEPFIRHAIVAFGGLGIHSKRMKHQQITGGAIDDPLKSQDYIYAVSQYDKAIRGMREAINNQKHDMRTALLACILVFCFETLHGNQLSAMANAESGLMLLHQWMQSENDKQLVHTPGKWSKGGIEEDIMVAFGGLDLQILFFLDRRPDWVHHCTIASSKHIIGNMPSEFTNLRQTSDYWSTIMRRNYHFIILALRAAKSRELSGPWIADDARPWEDSVNLQPGESIFSMPSRPPLELEDVYLGYREDIRQWSRSSAALMHRVRMHGDKDSQVLAALLEMHALLNHLMLAGVFLTSEAGWDQFQPEFETMLKLVEFCHPFLIGSAEGNNAFYHFDVGVVICCFFISSRCRDFVTRKKAVDLLASETYREGMWDSLAVARIGQWLMEIEEEGRDENGVIPEDKRVFMTTVVTDLQNKRAILACTQRSLDGLVFRTKDVTW